MTRNSECLLLNSVEGVLHIVTTLNKERRDSVYKVTYRWVSFPWILCCLDKTGIQFVKRYKQFSVSRITNDKLQSSLKFFDC